MDEDYKDLFPDYVNLLPTSQRHFLYISVQQELLIRVLWGFSNNTSEGSHGSQYGMVGTVQK